MGYVGNQGGVHPRIQNGNHFKFHLYILAVRSLIEVGKYMF